MKHDDVRELLRTLEACDPAKRWVGKNKGTSRKLWGECENGPWLLWLAGRVSIDRKLLVRAACACARESLKYVPAGEDRPRICIETTERWTRGRATIEEVRQARDSAYAVAVAFYAAVYAATDAAATAYAAAYADYAEGAADYAEGAAVYAAYAAADDVAAYADRQKAIAESLKQSAEIVREIISFAVIEKAAAAKLKEVRNVA